jgi:hypothetical protein
MNIRGDFQKKYFRRHRRKVIATIFLSWFWNFWLWNDLMFAQAAAGLNSLNQFIDPLKSGLNLIMVFGFIAGCVMVMGGFLNAKRDESWKMTVIYGLGVAGAVALMKALFSMFSGDAGATVQGF